MGIRAVIFDIGGVLLRTEDHSGRRKWEARLGLEENGLARHVWGSDVSRRASVGQASEDEVWAHIAAHFRLSDAEMREFVADFWSGDRVDQMLVQFLRDLRPRYKTGIISNAWATARHAITESFGIADALDTIVLSAEEGIEKPDARIYHIALRRLGVLPAEAIFVDDMPENVAAASALGMRGIQFQNTAQAIAEVRRYLDGASG